MSGYLWDSYVYLGSKEIVSNEERVMERQLEKSGAVVPKLMSKAFKKTKNYFWITGIQVKNI